MDGWTGRQQKAYILGIYDIIYTLHTCSSRSTMFQKVERSKYLIWLTILRCVPEGGTDFFAPKFLILKGFLSIIIIIIVKVIKYIQRVWEIIIYREVGGDLLLNLWAGLYYCGTLEQDVITTFKPLI